MKGVPGSSESYQNPYYYEFMEYLFEKNKQSPFPAPREQAYNLFQETIHEFFIRIDRDGAEFVLDKMRPNPFNKNL